MTSEAKTIPEDILAAATAVEDQILAADLHDIDTQMIIAKAILAERERCASFVEAYELASHSQLLPGSELNAWRSGQERAYEAVRRGIRGLPPFPKGGA